MSYGLWVMGYGVVGWWDGLDGPEDGMKKQVDKEGING